MWFINNEKEVSGRERGKLDDIVEKTRANEAQFMGLSDGELLLKTQEFRDYISSKEKEAEENGTKLKHIPALDIMPEAFGVVSETIDRRLGVWDKLILDKNFDLAALDSLDPKYLKKVLELREQLKFDQRKNNKTEMQRMREEAAGIQLDADFYSGIRKINGKAKFRPFDCQIMGAAVLAEGKIAEMKTGEGKTIVAAMPLYLHTLSGEGAHLATVNPYLARFGRNWMAPVYEALGLKVGLITPENDMLDYDEGLEPIRSKIKSNNSVFKGIGLDEETVFSFLQNNEVFIGTLKELAANIDSFRPHYNVQKTVEQILQDKELAAQFNLKDLAPDKVIRYQMEGQLTPTQKSNLVKVVSIIEEYDRAGIIDMKSFEETESSLFEESRSIHEKVKEMSNFDRLVMDINRMRENISSLESKSLSFRALRDLQGENAGLRNSIQEYIHKSKKDAYNSDITYVEISERAFDYLRDNSRNSLEDMVARGKFRYCLMDEVDSTLIDEAKTPFILSVPDPGGATLASQGELIFQKSGLRFDYNYDKDQKQIMLTAGGKEKLQKIIGQSRTSVSTEEIEQYLSNLLLNMEIEAKNSSKNSTLSGKLNLLKGEETVSLKKEKFSFLYMNKKSQYELGERGRIFIEEQLQNAPDVNMKKKDALKTIASLLNKVCSENSEIKDEEDFSKAAGQIMSSENAKMDGKALNTIVAVAAKVFIENRNLKNILEAASQSMGSDFFLDYKRNLVDLTDSGFEKIARSINSEYQVPVDEVYQGEHTQLLNAIQTAISVNHFFEQGKNYDIVDGKIIIVNEKTGRLEPGKRYSKGIHSAIEAKHEQQGVKVEPLTITQAEISHQSFFNLYSGMAGMSGTAKTDEKEFIEQYRLPVVVIPTNKPCQRIDRDDKIFFNKEAKYGRIILDVVANHDINRPILIGTGSINTSVEISERLSPQNIQKYAMASIISYKVKDLKISKSEKPRIVNSIYLQFSQIDTQSLEGLAKSLGIDCSLENQENIEILKEILNYKGTDDALKGTLRTGVEHNVLNARNHTQEAAIIANAGKSGAVTVATNMAGRGVDIILGGIENSFDPRYHDEINNLGGLLVIGTERHEARRIDNQLRGRAGRQGDNGESIFYLSWEDELLESQPRFNLMLKNYFFDEPIEHSWTNSAVKSAQGAIQANYQAARANVSKQDSIMQTQRNVVYTDREEIMASNDPGEITRKMIGQLVDDLANECSTKDNGTFMHQENIKDLLNSAMDKFKSQKDAKIEVFIEFLKSAMPYEEYVHKKPEENLEIADLELAIRQFVEMYNLDAKRNRNSLGLYLEVNRTVPINEVYSPRQFYSDTESQGIEKAKEKLKAVLLEEFEKGAKSIDQAEICEFERGFLLQGIDRNWAFHLENIDDLKETLPYRTLAAQSYGQSRDYIFSKEAFDLFNRFKKDVRTEYIGGLFKFLAFKGQTEMLKKVSEESQTQKLI